MIQKQIHTHTHTTIILTFLRISLISRIVFVLYRRHLPHDKIHIWWKWERRKKNVYVVDWRAGNFLDFPSNLRWLFFFIRLATVLTKNLCGSTYTQWAFWLIWFWYSQIRMHLILLCHRWLSHVNFSVCVHVFFCAFDSADMVKWNSTFFGIILFCFLWTTVNLICEI